MGRLTTSTFKIHQKNGIEVFPQHIEKASIEPVNLASESLEQRLKSEISELKERLEQHELFSIGLPLKVIGGISTVKKEQKMPSTTYGLVLNAFFILE